ncbi:MAG TPA: deoxyribose-phosphate aldolase [Candidatus Hydrogenedentes bacterium]|jgi:deoxyribose-phosphate aldolase|nr:deoxyribose-phosphate aldolase [Candidatus Hydrogenedentota bacterium]
MVSDSPLKPSLRLTQKQLARMIDHTQLRAYATQLDITELCDEAAAFGFASVSINPIWTAYCAKRLAGTAVVVDPTIGFPLGANTARIKIEEAQEAVRHGAQELDMVINIGALKSGFHDYVEKEIASIVRAVRGIPIKVILETSYLTTEEKVAVCQMSLRSGAAFVKTSTGFGDSGATIQDVTLMYEVVGKQMGIKAAGGVRTYGDAIALIEAGATRIGTSTGPSILEAAPR